MLGKLFGKKKGAPPQTSYVALSPAITGAIMRAVGTNGIPILPGAAQKAFSLSTDPNADARDFIEVIESDEALTARILKIANSVYFDRGHSSKTIDDAVQVIGINELRCLLNATTLTSLFPSRHPAREQLWANDVATGLIARTLARRLIPSKTELAFLAGLMHDIGKLLLLQRVPREYDQILESVAQKGTSFPRAEEELFPFDHTEVGQLVGERWSFSEDLIQVIRNHHRPWSFFRGEGNPLNLTVIVKSADCIAHSLGLGLSNRFNKFIKAQEEELQSVWSFLNIPTEERRSLLDSIKKTFEVEYDLFMSSNNPD